MTQGKKICLVAAAIIFVCYIGERFINVFVDTTRELALFEAIAFSLCTLIVYLLLVYSQEPYYGILIAALGFRMMPPDIRWMVNSESMAAGVVYYVVQKSALLIFAFAILRLYKYQDKDKLITPLSIIAVLVLMPFINDVSAVISDYLLLFTGKMYASYFACFILAAIAEIVLLFLASQTTKQGAIFICDFQIIALVLNIARRVLAIAIMTVRDTHVSKSYYVWIAIFAFFTVAFALMKKKRTNELPEEVEEVAVEDLD